MNLKRATFLPFHFEFPGRTRVCYFGGLRSQTLPKRCKANFMIWIWLEKNEWKLSVADPVQPHKLPLGLIAFVFHSFRHCRSFMYALKCTRVHFQDWQNEHDDDSKREKDHFLNIYHLFHDTTWRVKINNLPHLWLLTVEAKT